MSAARTFRSSQFGAPGITTQSLGVPAAAFPGRVATNSDLIVAVDRQQTTLLLPLTAAATSMTVLDPSAMAASSLLSIDNEIVKTTGPPAGNVIPISRGFDGTTAAAHLANALVSGLIDAYHHNGLVAEIEAIETALGPNLSHINTSNLPFLVSTAFNFPPQTPGGTLSPGNQVVTLTPVPQGVNGTNTNHYLYISGGTGTAEPVLITGGTAVSGASSGTVIVTCANSHSGAWTISSATSGIQEAIYSGPNYFELYIPAGTQPLYGNLYLPSSKYAKISGAGMGMTVLQPWPTAGNNIYLDSNPSSFLEFGDLLISRAGGQLGTSDTALYLNNFSPNAYIHDLAINYATDGIGLNSQPTMENIVISSFTDIGIHGVGSRCGGAWNNVQVGNNLAGGGSGSAPYAVKLETLIDGLYCVNCAFGGANFAVFVDPGSNIASNLFFSNTIFERYVNVGLLVQVEPASTGSGLILINNCRFVSKNTNNGSAAIQLVTNGGGTAPKIDSVTISNCYLSMNISGIRLAGVSNVTITGNTIFGTNLTGFPAQAGILLDSVTGGTVNKEVQITGNEIGYGQFGSTTRTNTDFAGGPLEGPIFIDAGAHVNVTITGNILSALSGNPVALQAIPAGLVMANNNGIDNVGYISIASAPSIVFSSSSVFTAYPFFTLTGSAGVTSVSGLWEGAKGMFLASSATPGAWTAGATIGNTFTPQTNVPVYWQFRGGKIWLK